MKLKNLPNFTKLSENSKIPLKPLFCVFAVLSSVENTTNKFDSEEYSTKFLCCPQYVPITADELSKPSYTFTKSKGQLKMLNVKKLDSHILFPRWQ